MNPFIRPPSFKPATLALALMVAFAGPIATAQVFGNDEEDEYTRSKLDEHVATMAKQIRVDGEIFSGELDENESDVIDLKIDPAKAYVVTAACNENCTEITIEGYAASAKTSFAIGAGDDDLPVMRVPPGQTDHLYIDLTMVDCYEDPCAYVLGVYEAK
jgi:hypothetical protein